MRVLKPELENFFRSVTGDFTGLTAPQIFLKVALACQGVKEEGGDNCGYVVELFQSVVSAPLKQSWCMDFIQACIAFTESVSKVPSPLPPTELCLDLWNRSKNYSAVNPPLPGDIIIWQLGGTIHGHTGIIVNPNLDSLHYQTIEGNTSDSAFLDRNGDGVYLKSRLKGGSQTFHEVGFLRAFT